MLRAYYLLHKDITSDMQLGLRNVSNPTPWYGMVWYGMVSIDLISVYILHSTSLKITQDAEREMHEVQ